jgi:hypothetical protein
VRHGGDVTRWILTDNLKLAGGAAAAGPEPTATGGTADDTRRVFVQQRDGWCRQVAGGRMLKRAAQNTHLDIRIRRIQAADSVASRTALAHAPSVHVKERCCTRNIPTLVSVHTD